MQVVAEKIVVLGTGGTIAGTAATAGDHLGYTSAQLGIAHLVASWAPHAPWPLETEQVAQIDSKDMHEVVWQQLAARCAHWLGQSDVRGLVITHGTDTLEETAFFLQRVLSPAKPVVLTCAMRPATALAPDGPQNLLDALAVAAAPGARGVVAVCAGTVHSALDVVKEHPYRLDAFSSGEAGPLGVVEEGRVRMLREWPAADTGTAAALARAVARAGQWPRVEIVPNHAGASGGMVQALVTQGVDGLVAAGTGNGTLATSLQAALLKAREQGVRVVRSTRCARGQVIAHGGDQLPDSAGLSPVKARVALMLEILARQPG